MQETEAKTSDIAVPAYASHMHTRQTRAESTRELGCRRALGRDGWSEQSRTVPRSCGRRITNQGETHKSLSLKPGAPRRGEGAGVVHPFGLGRCHVREGSPASPTRVLPYLNAPATTSGARLAPSSDSLPVAAHTPLYRHRSDYTGGGTCKQFSGLATVWAGCKYSGRAGTRHHQRLRSTRGVCGEVRLRRRPCRFPR